MTQFSIISPKQDKTYSSYSYYYFNREWVQSSIFYHFFSDFPSKNTIIDQLIDYGSINDDAENSLDRRRLNGEGLFWEWAIKRQRSHAIIFFIFFTRIFL